MSVEVGFEQVEFVRAIDVPPDAVIVLKASVILLPGQADAVREQVEREFPGRKVLVLGKDLDLVVLRDVDG